MIDEALAKKIRLLGITKAARHPMFQGKRINTKKGNFEYHGCWFCGERFPCELAKCDHAVFTRVGPCCDMGAGKVKR